MYIYIYRYLHIHIYIYLYKYIYIQRERERETEIYCGKYAINNKLLIDLCECLMATIVTPRGKTVVVTMRNGFAPTNKTKPICKSACL